MPAEHVRRHGRVGIVVYAARDGDVLRLGPRRAVVVAVGYINLLTNKPRWDFAVDHP